GGGPFGGGVQSFANGYNLPRYVFDLGLKKDFTWKNGTSLSLSLSVSDIFKTEFTESVINNYLYTQTSKRYRDQQLIRLNIRYQFGKFDLNIFRRKSNKAEGADNELNQ
ncbi:MAG: outer membrane beta-barrel protein, partial [Sediminibacterium sp.]|nr:outer membrane beta-barrel protein [Sediminibacterium sp.]